MTVRRFHRAVKKNSMLIPCMIIFLQQLYINTACLTLFIFACFIVVSLNLLVFFRNLMSITYLRRIKFFISKKRFSISVTISRKMRSSRKSDSLEFAKVRAAFTGKLFASTFETNVRGADFMTFLVTHAIRAAFGWRRLVAFSHGVRHAGAACPRTPAPGRPGTPTAVCDSGSFSYH